MFFDILRCSDVVKFFTKRFFKILSLGEFNVVGCGGGGRWDLSDEDNY